MSKESESNLNEMANIAGSGEGLALPPAFVFVQPRKNRKYKKGNDKVDGRTKGARSLFNRINKRKMKEQVETQIDEAIVSDTERAQKSIQQNKKLNRQKDMQKKRKEAKEKMMRKSSEMDTLMKARLSDFKKKASDQTKKLKKEEFTMDENIMETTTVDAMDVALQVATAELNPTGETSFAKITFGDGTQQNLDNFSAKRIAATYAQLDEPKQQQFRYMLNKDAATFQSALDFAIRNN